MSVTVKEDYYKIPGLDIRIKDYVQNTAAFNSRFASIYYPNIYITDPLSRKAKLVPPSGQLSGIYAKTDAVRGVHKAPAGIDDGRFSEVIGLEYTLDKRQRDTLYPARITSSGELNGPLP